MRYLNYLEMVGFLHIVLYTCTGLVFIGRAVIRGFQTANNSIEKLKIFRNINASN